MKENVNETTLYDRVKDNVKKIESSGNSWYYASLILFNIITLILCFLILDNYVCDVQTFSIIMEGFDYRLLLIMLIGFLCLIVLECLPLFLRMYSKTKSKRFLGVVSGVIASDFFGNVTINKKGKLPMFARFANNQKVSFETCVDCYWGYNFFEKFVFGLYSLIILLIGSIFFLGDTNIWLLLLAGIIVLIGLSKTIFVFVFFKNQKLAMKWLSAFVEFGYKIHIVRDVEKTYNNIVNNCIETIKDFKTNRWIKALDIVSIILKLFLKFCIFYFIVSTLNFVDIDMVGNLLLGFVIFEVIIKFWPLQKGMLVYEILFVTLFKNLFFEGYVFWGLLIYRIFDYFAYVLAYLLLKFVRPFCNKNTKIAD